MSRDGIVTVLVTGAGGVTGVAVLKALHASRSSDPRDPRGPGDLRILAADCRVPVAGGCFAERALLVPRADDPSFAERVLELCEKHDVDLVLPTLDAELPPLALVRARFSDRGTAIAVSEPDAVRVLDDKWLTYEFFREHGIPTPTTALLAEPEDVRFPALLKPRRGCGSNGIVRLVDRADVAWAARRFAPVDHVIQEWVDGDEYTVDLLCHPRGRPRSIVARRRVLTKAGVSYVGRTEDAEDLAADAGRIATGLGLDGPTNLQCIRAEKGVFWTEGNARFSGGYSLTCAAGVNGPAALVELRRTGRWPEIPRAKSGVTMLRYWEETYVEEA